MLVIHNIVGECFLDSQYQLLINVIAPTEKNFKITETRNNPTSPTLSCSRNKKRAACTDKANKNKNLAEYDAKTGGGGYSYGGSRHFSWLFAQI